VLPCQCRIGLRPPEPAAARGLLIDSGSVAEVTAVCPALWAPLLKHVDPPRALRAPQGAQSDEKVLEYPGTTVEEEQQPLPRYLPEQSREEIRPIDPPAVQGSQQYRVHRPSPRSVMEPAAQAGWSHDGWERQTH
jgi:hypothetical protein